MNQDPIVIAADFQNHNGESPLWDAARGRLLWLDNVTGEIFALGGEAPSGSRIAAGLPVCGMALNHDGRLVLAGPSGLLMWDGKGEPNRLVSEHDGEPLTFNDITAGPAGDIYGGTFHWDESGMVKRGKLYQVSSDCSVVVHDEGIALANGLSFSPDGRLLYFTDTMERVIHAYDVDAATGALRNRRVFARVPRSEGLPDGLAVDSEGHVWSAQWYGGVVVRYDPDGRVERRLRIPAQQASSLAFGGADLGDLFITSASDYWSSDEQPPAFDPSGPMGGALFRIRPGVRGLTPRLARFAQGHSH